MDFHDTTGARSECAATSSSALNYEEDARLSRPDQSVSIEQRCEDAEYEQVASLHYEAFSRYQKACLWLNIQPDKVTAEVLRLAALTDDPEIQAVRIGRLFSACGIDGEHHDRAREDLVETLAAYGARDEREMRLLYQIQVSHHMAMRCAGLAMEGGAHPAAVALHVSNYKKLSGLGMELERHLDAVKARGPLAADEPKQEIRVISEEAMPLKLELQPMCNEAPSHSEGTKRCTSISAAGDGVADLGFAPDTALGRDLL